MSKLTETEPSGRYYCTRSTPEVGGARCAITCGVGDGADHRPDCAYVADRIEQEASQSLLKDSSND